MLEESRSKGVMIVLDEECENNMSVLVLLYLKVKYTGCLLTIHSSCCGNGFDAVHLSQDAPKACNQSDTVPVQEGRED